MASEGGSERLGGSGVPFALRLGGAGLGEFGSEIAEFGVLAGFKTADLLFDRADAGDLTDIRGHAPEEQIAGGVEGASGEVAAVGLGLHIVRAREAGGKGGEGEFLNLDIGGEEGGGGLAIFDGGGAGEFERRDEPGLREVLVARRLGLAIPERLFFDSGGGEFADAFETDDGVAKVGDRGVAVLKVKTLEELLRIVGAHPVQGLADGIGRSTITGEREGALFRRHGGHGDHAFGRLVGGQEVIITGCGSRYGRFTPARFCRDTRMVRGKTPGWICTRWRT